MKRVILLADDSPTIRKVVELTFGDSSIRVESTNSGEQAWRRMPHLRPDLVLADAVMPAPDGYELCRRIKAMAYPVPVLLLSGTFEPFDEGRARACGADGHVRKPFEPATLLERVEALLARHPAPGPDVRPATDEPTRSATLAPDRWPPELLDALADAVAQRLAPEALSASVAQLLPAIAERVVRERIRQLERLDAGDDLTDDAACDDDRGTPPEGA